MLNQERNQMLNQKRNQRLLQSYIQDYKQILTIQNTKILKTKDMFIAEALYPFSETILKQQQQVQQNEQKQSEKNRQRLEKNELKEDKQNKEASDEKKQGQSSGVIQAVEQNQEEQEGIELSNSVEEKQQTAEIQYLTFSKGDKIKVEQAYQNGWWYGNTLKQPEVKGFFPSNYVQVSSRPKPPPPPPSQPLPQQTNDNMAYDPNTQGGIDWVQNELRNITQGPVKSDYYLGIKGYKNVKIDDKNQNILKGDHVKFDVSTGLAKVPVKDQAPAAKAVRQMGYYFDYHQWVQQRNKHPGQRSRPDPKKKKIKKLNLKGMK